MEKLTWMLHAEGIHPDRVVSHRMPLSQANEAYTLAAAGAAGKVVIVPEVAP
jgi:threonine dehydrogenase-like Zn-dependent dehydrogenase